MSLIFVLLLLLAQAALAAYRPRLAIVVLLLFASLESYRIPLGAYSMALSEAAMLAFVAGWLFFHRPKSLELDGFFLPALVLLAAALLSVIVSPSPPRALIEWGQLVAYLAAGYSIYCILASETLGSLRERGWFGYLLLFWFAAALLRWLVEGGAHWQAGFRDWNLLALAVSWFIPFVAPVDRRGWQNPSRSVSIYALGAGLAMIFLSFSRSGWGLFLLLILLTGAAYLYHRFQPDVRALWRRHWGWIAGAAALLLIVFWASGGWKALQQSVYLQARIGNNLLMILLFFEQPWFGVGIGHYAAYVQNMAQPMPFQLSTDYNSLLQLLCETGIAGGAAYAVLLGVPVKRAIVRWMRAPDQVDSYALVWACSSLLISGFLFSIHLHVAGWIMLGIFHAITRTMSPVQHNRAQD